VTFKKLLQAQAVVARNYGCGFLPPNTAEHHRTPYVTMAQKKGSDEEKSDFEFLAFLVSYYINKACVNILWQYLKYFSLPICSDVKTRKRRNVVGIDMI
jgi:hypothetical protein